MTPLKKLTHGQTKPWVGGVPRFILFAGFFNPSPSGSTELPLNGAGIPFYSRSWISRGSNSKGTISVTLT
jgi:hypothetical protein